MVGTSLGLGIGLQGQPRQYGEMAQRKLAGDAAIKKQEAAADKEYLDIFKQAVKAKEGYVLPGQREEYERIFAARLANMAKAKESRDYTGLITEYEGLKQDQRKYLQSYQNAIAVEKNLPNLVIDPELYQRVRTGDSNALIEAANTPYSGMTMVNGELIFNNIKRESLEKVLNTRVKPQDFELVSVGKQKGSKNAIQEYRMTPVAIEVYSNEMSLNPSLRAEEGMRLRSQFAASGQQLPDTETFEAMITENVKSNSKNLLNQKSIARNESGGFNITNVNNNAPTQKAMVTLSTDPSSILAYGDKKVRVEGKFSLGNTTTYTAAGEDYFDQNMKPLVRNVNEKVNWGESFITPTLTRALTADEGKKLVQKLKANGNNNDAEWIISQGSDFNRAGSPMPETIENALKEVNPETINFKIMTVGQVDGTGESRYSVANHNQYKSLIQASKEDTPALEKFIETRNQRQAELTKGARQGVTNNQPKATQPAQSTGQGRRLKYNPQTKKME
jgi:hypothetical protein